MLRFLLIGSCSVLALLANAQSALGTQNLTAASAYGRMFGVGAGLAIEALPQHALYTPFSINESSGERDELNDIWRNSYVNIDHQFHGGPSLQLLYQPALRWSLSMIGAFYHYQVRNGFDYEYPVKKYSVQMQVIYRPLLSDKVKALQPVLGISEEYGWMNIDIILPDGSQNRSVFSSMPSTLSTLFVLGFHLGTKHMLYGLESTFLLASWTKGDFTSSSAGAEQGTFQKSMVLGQAWQEGYFFTGVRFFVAPMFNIKR